MTRELLRQVGGSALGWIESRLSSFQLSALDDDLIVVREVKPVAELALTCDLLLRTKQVNHFGRKWIPFPLDVLAYCWDALDRGEVLRRLLLTYPDLFSLVTVYPPFYREGFRNPKLEGTIEALARDPGIRALEFPAWRTLDFAVALRSLGVASPWQVKAEVERTWLGHRPPPWMISDSAAYSLTHTVFYVTDFGFEVAGLASPARTYLRSWIPTWAAYYASVENLDLLAEMLMVAYCVGLEGMDDSLTFLAKRQRRDGSVPGPSVVAESLGFDRRSSSRQVRFIVDYHTTLVSIMASALGLRRGSSQARSGPRGR